MAEEIREHLKPPHVIDRKLGRERACGQFEAPDLIEIDPRLDARERLDTVLHELLHWAMPEWSEKQVARTATAMMKIMWKDGWRRVQK
jgi:hypothetical protein